MTIQTDWWKTFFSGLWLDVQRETWSPEESRAQADFIEKTLGVSSGARLLDVPCGEGRLAIEMAARGFAVTGVDITLPLLEDARKNAAECGADVDWELADMRDLPWKEEFDGAFCFWGSLGYFDDESDEAFLYSAWKSLTTGARFILDTHIAETLLPRFEERGWRKAGETLVVEDRSWDHVRGRVDVEWTFVKDGSVERAPSSIRVYTYRELCDLLSKLGFSDFEGYGSLSQEPFGLGSERLLLVAQKKS